MSYRSTTCATFKDCTSYEL
uniref:Uncharacterized protein n=1 Tax=Arundo donax TaxID=35708 RepID=A0A0A9ASD2_ARUDO